MITAEAALLFAITAGFHQPKNRQIRQQVKIFENTHGFSGAGPRPDRTELNPGLVNESLKSTKFYLANFSAINPTQFDEAGGEKTKIPDAANIIEPYTLS